MWLARFYNDHGVTSAKCSSLGVARKLDTVPLSTGYRTYKAGAGYMWVARFNSDHWVTTVQCSFLGCARELDTSTTQHRVSNAKGRSRLYAAGGI